MGSPTVIPVFITIKIFVISTIVTTMIIVLIILLILCAYYIISIIGGSPSHGHHKIPVWGLPLLTDTFSSCDLHL